MDVFPFLFRAGKMTPNLGLTNIGMIGLASGNFRRNNPYGNLPGRLDPNGMWKKEHFKLNKKQFR